VQFQIVNYSTDSLKYHLLVMHFQTCHFKCSENISADKQDNIFHYFWNLGCWKQQTGFVPVRYKLQHTVIKTCQNYNQCSHSCTQMFIEYAENILVTLTLLVYLKCIFTDVYYVNVQWFHLFLYSNVFITYSCGFYYSSRNNVRSAQRHPAERTVGESH